MTDNTLAAAQAWARQAFACSALKQLKFRHLRAMLPPLEGRRCLDIGGDNGVISFMLRELGGEWSSAELTEDGASAIRGVVGERVFVMPPGRPAPFADRSFDLVVVVDYLEHVADDRLVIDELARILVPGGLLVINVPHPRPGHWLERLRHRLGLTDQWHGHLRPGYDLEKLRGMLEGRFELERYAYYHGPFSELVDTALNFMYMSRQKNKQTSAKGLVVTAEDWVRRAKEAKLLKAAHPVLKAFCALDALTPWAWRHRLVVRARRS